MRTLSSKTVALVPDNARRYPPVPRTPRLEPDSVYHGPDRDRLSCARGDVHRPLVPAGAISSLA
jgi:hypothetical protein